MVLVKFIYKLHRANLALKHMAAEKHNIPKRQFIGQNYIVQIQVLSAVYI